MKRLLLVLAVLATGCWRMTIRNGNPVGETPIDFDNKWHSGVVYGLAELTRPYDVSKVCPRGWAEYHIRRRSPRAWSRSSLSTCTTRRASQSAAPPARGGRRNRGHRTTIDVRCPRFSVLGRSFDGDQAGLADRGR